MGYTPAVSLISFTIDGTTYQSPESWTWADWLDSSYSPEHLAYDGTSYVTSSGCPICDEDAITTVDVTEPLEDGGIYVSCP